MTTGPSTDAIAAATLIAGLLAPVLTTSLKNLPADLRDLIGLGISLALGTVALALTGGFSHTGWEMALLSVVGTAQVVYTLLFPPARKLKSKAASSKVAGDKQADAVTSAKHHQKP